MSNFKSHSIFKRRSFYTPFVTVIIMRIILCYLFFDLVQIFGLEITNEDALHKTGYVDGDFIIGALFPVHGSLSSDIDKDDALRCDSMRGQLGIQFVEAAFFAVDAINKNEHLLPGIKLGIAIKDECWNDQVAMYQTMQLIQKRATITQPKSDPLLGIIGSSSKTSTHQVKSLANLYKVPHINYAVPLLDFQSSKYFLSVVPNRLHDIPLILRTLKEFGWDHVSLLYGEEFNFYNENELFLFQEWASKLDICIAKRLFLSPRNQIYNENEIHELFQNKKARVIVCFCEEPTLTALYKQMHERNLAGKYLLLISSNWYTDSSTFRGYENEARGSMVVEKGSTYLSKFDDYFLGMNTQNNKRNPWFEEFWQFQFQCNVNGENSDLPACTGKEDLKINYKQRPEVSYIVKSIYTLAYGLDKMRTDLCKTQSGTCSELDTFNTTVYMNYLENLDFAFHDEFIHFDRSGFTMSGRYNIFDYQIQPNGSLDKVKISQYDFDSIFSSENPSITPSDHFNYIHSVHDGKSSFKSSCSDPCTRGLVKRRGTKNAGTSCCWSCEPCAAYEIWINETTCESCPSGYWPDSGSSNCILIPTIYSGLTKWQLVAAKTMSSFGILLTVLTTYVFIKHRNTPVVKSSTPELCYLILIGVFMLHGISFGICFRPALLSCIFIETLPSISSTIIYVSLLVKTNRIARLLAISNEKFPNPHPRFMSLKAQFVISFILIIVVVIVSIISSIFTPPYVDQSVDVIENNVYINVDCVFSGNFFYFCMVYKTVLLILGTYYAIRCRNIPDNFNETKYIAFLMYVICIGSVAYTLVYFGTTYRMLSRGIYASVTGQAVLVLLFFPKLYVILWMPEKNTRQYFITTTGIRFTFGRSDDEYITRKYPKNEIKIVEDSSTRQQSVLTKK